MVGYKVVNIFMENGLVFFNKAEKFVPYHPTTVSNSSSEHKNNSQ